MIWITRLKIATKPAPHIDPAWGAEAYVRPEGRPSVQSVPQRVITAIASVFKRLARVLQ